MTIIHWVRSAVKQGATIITLSKGGMTWSWNNVGSVYDATDATDKS